MAYREKVSAFASLSDLILPDWSRWFFLELMSLMFASRLDGPIGWLENETGSKAILYGSGDTHLAVGQGLKPAVPWCFNFDPYPLVRK